MYLDFADSIQRLGEETIRERYGNLFQIYETITGENAYQTPMRIYPAPHYAMGGLWVDYHLMSNIPGLFVIGEANFSDHGANRLGASALMQGLADGYFILPYTIGTYFASEKKFRPATDAPAFKEAEESVRSRIQKLLSIRGKRTVASIHRELGQLMWNLCGMSRNEAGLKQALEKIPALRKEFWENVKILGNERELNQSLEHAGRLADFLEFAEVLCYDALQRRESCGGHFREEFQTEEGEAVRNDDEFSYVAAWGYAGEGRLPELHKETLEYEEVKMATRSYK